MQVDVRPALAVVHRTATLLALAVMLATAGGCRMQSLTDETLTSGAIGTPNGTLPGSGGHSQPSSDWIAAAVDAPSAMPVSAISSSTPTELPTPVLPKGTPTYAGAAVDFLRTPTAGMLPGVTDIYLRSGQSILIAKTDLNVRAGPGVDFEVLGYLTTAQWAVATGTNDDASWLRINVPSAPGRSGWVARNYVNVTDLAGLTEVAVPTLSPSATPTTTPTATPGATNTPETEAGWQGEYFDNISLDGEPVLVRTDSGIDFEWSDKAPADGLPADYFSVRWTSMPNFGEGTYYFEIEADDGVRLWIDGELILDEWHDAESKVYKPIKWLDEGPHHLRLEYYEHLANAAVRITWRRPGDWTARYYPNRKLEDDAVIERYEEEIDYNWSGGSPDPALPLDNFSARWECKSIFDEGLYVFNAQADDGIRLWVGDDLVIDSWKDGIRSLRAERYYSQRVELPVRVEYYERWGDASVWVSWRRNESDD